MVVDEEGLARSFWREMLCFSSESLVALVSAYSDFVVCQWCHRFCWEHWCFWHAVFFRILSDRTALTFLFSLLVSWPGCLTAGENWVSWLVVPSFWPTDQNTPAGRYHFPHFTSRHISDCPGCPVWNQFSAYRCSYSVYSSIHFRFFWLFFFEISLAMLEISGHPSESPNSSWYPSNPECQPA